MSLYWWLCGCGNKSHGNTPLRPRLRCTQCKKDDWRPTPVGYLVVLEEEYLEDA